MPLWRQVGEDVQVGDLTDDGYVVREVCWRVPPGVSMGNYTLRTRTDIDWAAVGEYPQPEIPVPFARLGRVETL